ncbi:hypothetical protein AABB24_021356, partial [Solanum stoloniferum]
MRSQIQTWCCNFLLVCLLNSCPSKKQYHQCFLSLILKTLVSCCTFNKTLLHDPSVVGAEQSSSGFCTVDKFVDVVETLVTVFAAPLGTVVGASRMIVFGAVCAMAGWKNWQNTPLQVINRDDLLYGHLINSYFVCVIKSLICYFYLKFVLRCVILYAVEVLHKLSFVFCNILIFLLRCIWYG